MIDIIECMANSDNVIRGGFTSKFKDIDVLIDMFDYLPQTMESIKLLPSKCPEEDSYSSIYNPPTDEFSVKKIQVDFLLLYFLLRHLTLFPIKKKIEKKNMRFRP